MDEGLSWSCQKTGEIVWRYICRRVLKLVESEGLRCFKSSLEVQRGSGEIQPWSEYRWQTHVCVDLSESWEHAIPTFFMVEQK